MANKDLDGAYVRSIVAKIDDGNKDSPAKSPTKRPVPSYLGVSRTNSGYNNSLIYGADHRMDQSTKATNGSGGVKSINGSDPKSPPFVSLAMLGPAKTKCAPSKYSDLGLNVKSPEKNCRSFTKNISSFEMKFKCGDKPRSQSNSEEAVTMVGKKMQHLLHLENDVPDFVQNPVKKDFNTSVKIVPKEMEDFVVAVNKLLSSVEDRSAAEGLGKSDHDGTFFRQVAEVERNRLLRLCDTASSELEHTTDIPDDAKGRLRAVEGKARLLMNERFIQFYGLCEDNLHPPPGGLKVGPVDLAGFWDMVLIEVHWVYNEFRKIKDLKERNWELVEDKKENKVPTSRPRSSGGKKVAERSGTASAKNEALNKERKKKIEELRKLKNLQNNDKNEVEICISSKKSS